MTDGSTYFDMSVFDIYKLHKLVLLLPKIFPIIWMWLSNLSVYNVFLKYHSDAKPGKNRNLNFGPTDFVSVKQAGVN
jgi:hypothetical protein